MADEITREALRVYTDILEKQAAQAAIIVKMLEQIVDGGGESQDRDKELSKALSDINTKLKIALATNALGWAGLIVAIVYKLSHGG